MFSEHLLIFVHYVSIVFISHFSFLDPKASLNATLVVLVLLVVISSLKMPNALICSGAQTNFAYTFALTFPTDLPSQILKLISN